MKKWNKLTNEQKRRRYAKTYAIVRKNPLITSIHAAATATLAVSIALYAKKKIDAKTLNRVSDIALLVPDAMTLATTYVVCTTKVK